MLNLEISFLKEHLPEDFSMLYYKLLFLCSGDLRSYEARKYYIITFKIFIVAFNVHLIFTIFEISGFIMLNMKYILIY